MENKPADRLVLERTQPVQGQRVDVLVLWNGQGIGEVSFEFQAWLKFKRLLEKGMDLDAREDHSLNLRLTVKGRERVAVGEAYPTRTAPEPYRGGISNLAAEDEQDAEDLAAIAAAEAGSLPPTNPPAVDAEPTVTEGLIRSLRRDNADG